MVSVRGVQFAGQGVVKDTVVRLGTLLLSSAEQWCDALLQTGLLLS
jgi:hypothetical protein